MKTITQALADTYSDVGSQQIMVAVYENQAAVYAQVSKATAVILNRRLSRTGGLMLRERRAMSADGLTHCWTFDLSPEFKASVSDGKDFWLPFLMVRVSDIMRSYIPDLLENGNVMYVDNRGRDANTLEAYGSVLGVR